MAHNPLLPTRYEALQAVVSAYGTQQATADALGVTQAAVWKWLHQSRRLPAEHVLKAEADTGVSRHWLRPDIYPFGHPPAPEVRFAGVDQRARRVA